MQNLVLFTAGLLPALIIAFLAFRFLYKKSQLLASKAILAVMLGILSALPAYFIESSLSNWIEIDHAVWWQALGMAFLLVALIEEIAKTTMLWLSNYVIPVDEGLDLMAISVLIAMGFAGVENILYSYSKGWEVALFRSLTAVPAHACFALLIGYFVAMNFPRRKSIFPYVQGLVLAWILHGLYDFFIIQEISESLLVGALFVLFVSGLLAYRTYSRVAKSQREGEKKEELINKE